MGIFYLGCVSKKRQNIAMSRSVVQLALPRVRLGAAVAEEVAELGVRDVVAPVANARAHCAHTNAVHHLARVTVVPVLVHELALGHRESTQLVLQHRVFVLAFKKK